MSKKKEGEEVNKIAELRKAAGFTQEEFAARLCVTQGAVSQWEQGMSSPSIDKLPLLAKLLGCTIDELF